MKILKLVLSASIFLCTSLALGQSSVEDHFINGDDSPKADIIIAPMVGVRLIGIPQQIGVRASMEVVPDGFIRILNDSVSGEVGIFTGRFRKDPVLYLNGNLRWDFHLVPDWTVFGAPGIMLRRLKDDNDDEILPSVSALVGGFYNFQDNMALRADFELQDLVLRAGVAFRF